MKDMGDFRLSLNPALEKALSGEEMQSSMETDLYAGLYWRRYFLAQPGVEYYGKFGEVKELPGQQDQPHELFGVLNMHFLRGMMLQVGAGHGLTDGSDQWVGKVDLRYEFETLKPGEQAW